MRRILLYLFIAVGLPWGHAATISPFDHLSSHELLKLSQSLVDRGHRTDSALLYLTEVLTRFYDNPANKKTSDDAAEALRLMSDIYWNTYHDYGATVTSLYTAIELAEAENLTDLLPFLYLDMARLWDTNGLAFRDGNPIAESYLRKAHKSAINSKNRDALPTVAFNMCIFRLARGKKYFQEELSTIAKSAWSEEAPCGVLAPLYIEGTYALEGKDYCHAGALFHKAASSTAKGSDERRAVLGAMQLEAEMICLQGNPSAARSLLIGYLQEARTATLPGYSQAICRKLSALYKRAEMTDSATHYEARWLSERETERQNSLFTPDEMVLLASAPSAEARIRENHIARLQRERQLIFVVGGSLVLLLVAAFSFRAWRVQKRNALTLFAQNKTLLEDAAQLRILRSQIETSKPEAETPKIQKYKASLIDPSMSADLYQKLLYIMDTNPAIYSTGFRLENLASLAGLLPRYVSQIINENSGSNFNQLLNQYRIREVQRRLRDDSQYGNLTIEAVAESVGFLSRSTFTQIFKQHTGLTPNQYRKMERGAEP